MATHVSQRPELVAPADVFYSSTEAEKYTSSSRMVTVQTQMAERCIELLAMPPSKKAFILDIGVGSGLSGAALTAAGHAWVGFDIAKDMLGIAKARGASGDLILCDMGQGFGFRPGTFDGVISVSAVQWLCFATQKRHTPMKRITRFFHSLYGALRRGGRAALQLYPKDEEQLEMLTTTAMRCGFSGGLVVDYPNSTKAKKYYLVISAGTPGTAARITRRKGKQKRGAGAGGGAGVAGMEDGEDEDEDEDDDEAMGVGIGEGAGELGRAAKGGAGGGSSSSAAAWADASSSSSTGPAVGAGVRVIHRPSGGSKPVYRKKKGTKWQRKELPVTRRDVIMHLKDKAKGKGKKVKRDSKYSGRKRKDRF